MAIPKIIHLCHFGRGELSRNIQACLASSTALARNGYRIMLWTEDNYDINKSKLAQSAYRDRKWSLMSNYVRLDVLIEFGGVYLDTDIEVLKTFDDLLDAGLFIGFMWDCNLGTAVIGCVPDHRIVKAILARYEADPSTFRSPNNDTFTRHFIDHVPGFALNGHAQVIDDIHVFDRFAFEQPSLLKRTNYTVHHFEQSWSRNTRKKKLRQVAIKLLSLYIYRRYLCWRYLYISPFYDEYINVVRSQRRVSRRGLDTRRSSSANAVRR